MIAAIEINSSADIAAFGFKVAAGLWAFSWLLTEMINQYEHWRQQRATAKEAERLAQIEARKLDAHYERALKAASQLGTTSRPWWV